MATIRYEPISKLMYEFKEFEEELTEELQNSCLSWGSEKQLTLGNAEYIYDVIDSFFSEQLENARELQQPEKIALYEEKLKVLARVRSSRTEYYCMEE